MKKISKYIEYATTKVVQAINEKRYHADGVTVKYMYKPFEKSDILLVVFGSCTRQGIRARYNYVRTLSNVKCNQVFLLDDYAEDHRGAYYLGYNCGNEIEKACAALIQELKEKSRSSKVIFCGSSKGGWAALNLMTYFPGANAIVGAPQYHLADYLMSPPLESCRKYIIPDPSIENMKYINDYLKNKLTATNGSGRRVYIHYSDQEHTFKEHVEDLLHDLKENEYEIIPECMDYTNHSDISLHFPAFLTRSIADEMK